MGSGKKAEDFAKGSKCEQCLRYIAIHSCATIPSRPRSMSLYIVAKPSVFARRWILWILASKTCYMICEKETNSVLVADVSTQFCSIQMKE